MEYVVQLICMYIVLTDVVQVMLVSLGLCLPSATASDVTLFGTVVVIRSKIKIKIKIKTYNRNVSYRRERSPVPNIHRLRKLQIAQSTQPTVNNISKTTLLLLFLHYF